MSDYKGQSIDKLKARLRRLEADNEPARRDDFMRFAKGVIDEATMDWRCARRDTEIETLRYEIEDRDCEADREEKRERQKLKRKRFHRVAAYPMSRFPYYPDLDLTKAERAVLVAFGMASGGRLQFWNRAHGWLAKRVGCSVKTVQRMIARMVSHGLIDRIERWDIVDGVKRNKPNKYIVKCEKLGEWILSLFLWQDKTGLHRVNPDISLTTCDENGPSACSNKGLRARVRGERSEINETAGERRGVRDMDSAEFDAVARGALSVLGHEVPDALPCDGLEDAVDRLRRRLQPGFIEYFWARGVGVHGRRRALLAFLETRILKDARRNPGDDRPINERDPIRDANRYLSGILKSAAGACLPELTLGARLSAHGVEIPEPVELRIRAHMARRKGKGRAWASAA